jgi:hypothetical protein
MANDQKLLRADDERQTDGELSATVPRPLVSDDQIFSAFEAVYYPLSAMCVPEAVAGIWIGCVKNAFDRERVVDDFADLLREDEYVPPFDREGMRIAARRITGRLRELTANMHSSCHATPVVEAVTEAAVAELHRRLADGIDEGEFNRLRSLMSELADFERPSVADGRPHDGIDFDRVLARVRWYGPESAVALAAVPEDDDWIPGEPSLGDLAATVERMKGAGEAEARKGNEKGKQLGIAWAKAQATPEQLRRLDVRYGKGKFLYHEDSDGCLANAVAGTVQSQGLWQDADACGYRDDPAELSAAFVIGFVQGALQVWDRVEP